MIIEIKVPSPGESISEVEIGKWLIDNGSVVRKDQEIAEVESDKATLSLIATVAGQLSILAAEGERVAVGSIVCTIDTDMVSVLQEVVVHPTLVSPEKSTKNIDVEIVDIDPTPAKNALPLKNSEISIKMTPTAKAVMEQANLSVEEVLEGIKRLTRKDMELIVKANESPKFLEKNRSEDRVTMTPLRRKLSQRLVAVKNETAMLTTFNEVDMTAVIELRTKYQKAFTDKHGFKLGFNAFFAKAASMALTHHPSVNSMLEGDAIITPKYHDIGIAVSSPKGLMVPIIRNLETMNLSQIEGSIKELAEKARDKKLTVFEMTGGTFTITNGGIFGSMMSTPIINPPQSAILGLHAIKDRPVAINGKIEIRPMMYVALSYDHRIIDGKDSVGFLVKIKEMVENPTNLIFGGKNAEEILLEL